MVPDLCHAGTCSVGVDQIVAATTRYASTPTAISPAVELTNLRVDVTAASRRWCSDSGTIPLLEKLRTIALSRAPHSTSATTSRGAATRYRACAPTCQSS